MDLRHLRYLIGVADAATFTAAASALRIAQPALSRQVRDLEEELGVELLVRGLRGVTLTPAGEAVVAIGRQLIEAIAKAGQQARLADTGLAGRCVLGLGRVPPLMGYGAGVVARVRERYPQLDLVPEERLMTEQFDALRDGSVDVGLGAAPPGEIADLAWETQFVVRADAVLLSRSHPLARRARLSVAELLPYPQLRARELEGTSYALAVDAELARIGLESTIEYADSMASGINRIASSNAWAIMSTAVPPLLPGATVHVPLTDFVIPVRLCRVWRRGDERPVTRTVLSVLRAMEREARDEQPAAEPAASGPAPVTGSAGRTELRHLRYLATVAEQGSFGRAAEELGISQPALSRQIRDLEYDVGVSLLERESRGVRLTLAGEAFLPHARRAIRLESLVQPEVARAKRGARGECVLATRPEPTIAFIVAAALRDVQHRVAGAVVTAEDVPSPRQLDALEAGRIDIGVGYATTVPPAVDDGIRRVRLVEDPLDGALLHAGHPLAARASIRAAELADEPWLFITRPFSPRFHDMVVDRLATVGLQPRRGPEADGLVSLWTMAAHGLGWVLATHSQRAAPPAGTVVVPFEDFTLSWGVDLMFRRDERRDVVLAMVDLLHLHSPRVFASRPTPRSAQALRR